MMEMEVVGRSDDDDAMEDAEVDQAMDEDEHNLDQQLDTVEQRKEDHIVEPQTLDMEHDDQEGDNVDSHEMDTEKGDQRETKEASDSGVQQDRVIEQPQTTGSQTSWQQIVDLTDDAVVDLTLDDDTEDEAS